MKMKAGFTLIELLVAIAIITIMSTVVFFNFPKLNQQILMNREARNLTLAFRDAQARAVAVAQFGGLFPSNYGVHLEADHYVIFTDLDEPGHVTNYYDGTDSSSSCTDECAHRTAFSRGVKITKISDWSGNVETPLDVAQGINILFYRPDPNMVITNGTTCVAGNCLIGGGGYGPFRITLTSADGTVTKIVDVWRTGQISIR